MTVSLGCPRSETGTAVRVPRSAGGNHAEFDVVRRASVSKVLCNKRQLCGMSRCHVVRLPNPNLLMSRSTSVSKVRYSTNSACLRTNILISSGS